MGGSPFNLLNPDPQTLFEPIFGPLSSGLWRFFRFDPDIQDYREFTPGDPFFDLLPGRGFWLITRNGGTINITGTPNDASVPFDIQLAPGFNQISTPFNFIINWFDPCFRRPDAISDTLIGVNRGGGYGLRGFLRPAGGYWVFNNASFPVTLSVPPIPVVEGSSIDEFSPLVPVPWKVSAGGGWRIKMSAKAGETEDTDNYLGVDTISKDGLDALDYPEPPAVHGLSLYFPHPGWNWWAWNYTTDIRKPSIFRKITWNFEVWTDLPNTRVELSWTLEGITGEILTLRDIGGNQVIDMKAKHKYHYNSGLGGIRHFRVVKR
jgi:hypothetical protein